MITGLPDRNRETIKTELRQSLRFENTDDVMAFATSVSSAADKHGLESVVAALYELLEDGDNFVCPFCAHWLRIIRANSDHSVRADQEAQALRVLLEVLSIGTCEQKLLVISFLTLDNAGGMKAPAFPEEAIPVLLKLSRHADPRLEVAASAALLPRYSGKSLRRLLATIESALSGDDLDFALMAAQAFARMKMRNKNVRLLLRPISRMDELRLLSLVNVVASMGEQALPLLPGLIERYHAVECPEHLKIVLLTLFASVCGKPEDAKETHQNEIQRVRELMLDVVRGDEWPLLRVACAGLRDTGGVPEEAIARLVELLSHPKAEVRCDATKCLTFPEPFPVVAIPALIERLQREESEEVAPLVVESLAHAVEAAIPALFALLYNGEMPVIARVAAVLVQGGKETASRLAEEFLDNPDATCREFCITILNRMGARGLSALPVAIRLLQSTEPLARQHGAMAICSMGPNATAAIPYLIGLLQDSNLETLHWAKTAITRIGAGAVPALRAAYANGNMPESVKLEIAAIIHYFGSSTVDIGSEGFDWFGDDNTLILVAWIGQSLRSKVKSMPELVRELNQLEKARRWNKGKLFKETTIRDRIKKLQVRVNQKRKSNIEFLEKGGDRNARGLTEDGKQLLDQIINYLKKKGSLVIPGQEGDN